MRRLLQYFALAPAARALLRESLVLLPAVALSLRLRGMARTAAALERRAQRAGEELPALAPQEIARVVNAAARLLRVRCLPRSLALWHALRVRGLPAEVRLGVSKPTGGGLAAHAWVEFDGLPLNDSQDVAERYPALPHRHSVGASEYGKRYAS